jgi:hypothetical protein
MLHMGVIDSLMKRNNVGGKRMKTDLGKVIGLISEDFKNDILATSRFYREVSIGERAERLGLTELKGQYRDVFAIVPLKQPAEGMKVRIDGRTFVNYAQFEFGVVVPRYVAEDTGLPYKPFVPNDSMILNFT